MTTLGGSDLIMAGCWGGGEEVTAAGFFASATGWSIPDSLSVIFALAVSASTLLVKSTN